MLLALILHSAENKETKGHHETEGTSQEKRRERKTFLTLEESLQLVVLSRAKTEHAPGSQGSRQDAISITYNAMWDPSSDPCLFLRLRRLHSERALAAFEIRTTVSPGLSS